MSSPVREWNSRNFPKRAGVANHKPSRKLEINRAQYRRAFVGVENLSSFIANRLSGTGGKFDLFLVADEAQISTPEFVRQIAFAAGKTARLVPLPLPVLQLLLRMSGRPEARDSLIGSMEIDLSKMTATGWRPPLSLEEGLRRAVSAS